MVAGTIYGRGLKITKNGGRGYHVNNTVWSASVITLTDKLGMSESQKVP